MLADRVELYRRIEALRGRPLVFFATSARANAGGQISGDCVAELMDQLNALPAGTTQLDLMIVSNGGDPTAAWRIVSLIRERVSEFAVLVPQAAYSAATLIALGANEIVMHPNGNLGPTDPQIRSPKRNLKDQQPEVVNFGSEDLSAFLKFARDEVGLTDQSQMLSVFNHFCEEVGSVAVGVSARSAQLSVTMGEKLLQLHMNGDSNRTKARSIAQALSSNYLHHGYAVSRSEARDIELPVASSNPELENLMWRAWHDLSLETEQRIPFQPLALVRNDPGCGALFGPLPFVQLPPNLPPAVQQQAINNVLQQVGVIQVPPVPFKMIHAVMESTRLASAYESGGLIFATRLPDLNFKVNATVDKSGWISATVTEPAQQPRPPRPAQKATKSVRKAAQKVPGRRRPRKTA